MTPSHLLQNLRTHPSHPKSPAPTQVNRNTSIPTITTYRKLLITYQFNAQFNVRRSIFRFISPYPTHSRSLFRARSSTSNTDERVIQAPTSSEVWWFGTRVVFSLSSHTFRSRRSDGHTILICLSVRLLSHSYQPCLIKCPIPCTQSISSSTTQSQLPHQLPNPKYLNNYSSPIH